jgi:hypothetical protein
VCELGAGSCFGCWVLGAGILECWIAETNDCGEGMIRVESVVAALGRCFFAQRYTGVVRDGRG